MFLIILQANAVSRNDPASSRESRHTRMQKHLEEKRITPSPQAGGTDLVWLTQWHAPSSTDPHGGKLFFAYMESTAGQAPKCFDGQNGLYVNGGGAGITYPGNAARITPSVCFWTGLGVLHAEPPFALRQMAARWLMPGAASAPLLQSATKQERAWIYSLSPLS